MPAPLTPPPDLSEYCDVARRCAPGSEARAAILGLIHKITEAHLRTIPAPTPAADVLRELLIAAKEAAVVINEITKACGIDPLTGGSLPRLARAINRAEGKP